MTHNNDASEIPVTISLELEENANYKKRGEALIREKLPAHVLAMSEQERNEWVRSANENAIDPDTSKNILAFTARFERIGVSSKISELADDLLLSLDKAHSVNRTINCPETLETLTKNVLLGIAYVIHDYIDKAIQLTHAIHTQNSAFRKNKFDGISKALR